MNFITPGVREQIDKYFKSFIGAIVAGAVIAGANWTIAHIPAMISFFLMMGGGYVGQHVGTTTPGTSV